MEKKYRAVVEYIENGIHTRRELFAINPDLIYKAVSDFRQNYGLKEYAVTYEHSGRRTNFGLDQALGVVKQDKNKGNDVVDLPDLPRGFAIFMRYGKMYLYDKWFFNLVVANQLEVREIKNSDFDSCALELILLAQKMKKYNVK